MHKTFELGKIDYNSKNCPVTIDIEFDGKRFSASGAIWNPIKSDCYTCGQMLDEIAEYFPHNEIVQKIVAIWRDWHLNDMTAGSPNQERYLKEHPVSYQYPKSHYTAACEALTQAGLHPDPNYIHNGKPYAYGSAWLTRDIPADIVADINKLMGA